MIFFRENGGGKENDNIICVGTVSTYKIHDKEPKTRLPPHYGKNFPAGYKQNQKFPEFLKFSPEVCSFRRSTAPGFTNCFDRGLWLRVRGRFSIRAMRGIGPKCLPRRPCNVVGRWYWGRVPRITSPDDCTSRC